MKKEIKKKNNNKAWINQEDKKKITRFNTFKDMYEHQSVIKEHIKLEKESKRIEKVKGINEAELYKKEVINLFSDLLKHNIYLRNKDKIRMVEIISRLTLETNIDATRKFIKKYKEKIIESKDLFKKE